MLESQIEKKLSLECRRRGWLSIKVGQNGWPDRVIITPGGRHYWIELKAEGGRLSARQIVAIKALRDAGCDARVVVGADGVDQFFANVL